MQIVVIFKVPFRLCVWQLTDLNIWISSLFSNIIIGGSSSSVVVCLFVYPFLCLIPPMFKVDGLSYIFLESQ